MVKFISYSIFFILALMYFSPKIEIYYYLENKLNSHAIVISDEKLQDNGLNLKINDAVVSVKEIESAKISEIDIKVFGVYNKLRFKDIQLSPAISSLVPTNIKELDLSYSIFNPLKINAHANGEFGKLDASFDLVDFNLQLNLYPSAIMKKDFALTLKNLKKLKTGVYSYDKTF